MRLWLANLLIRAAVRLTIPDKRNTDMGRQLPTNIPVPCVTVVAISATFAVFAYYTNGIEVGCVGAFVKEEGAADFTVIGPVLQLNFKPSEMKAYLASKYGGDERAFIKAEIEPHVNPQLDAYVRGTYGWEQIAGSQLLTPQQIDALPDGYEQINHTLANFGAIMVDSEKKTIQFYG